MKTITKAIVPALSLALLMSCGAGQKEKAGALGDKKVELEKLKTDRGKLNEKIAILEGEIAKLDTSASTQKPKLVSLTTVAQANFVHYLTLQGFVDQKNISYITPSGQPGQIKAIYVKQGDHIRKGQLVLKLDNDVAMQNVNSIKQQLNSINAQLALAKSVYSRQKNLWDQNIGTEVQLLQAKTNVETLEGQLKTVQASVKAAEVQANQSNVYSNVNGVVDDVTAHVGETFNGNPAGGGYIRIVNNGDTRVSVTIPENYASKVNRGDRVKVLLPDNNKSFDGIISFISQSIGATTRGFVAEIRVPSGISVKPNQTAVVNIIDYTSANAISVPLNTVQNDEDGKYVLVAVKQNNELVAQKKRVTIGQFSNDSVEIKQGLQPGESLITGGYQGVFEGQQLTTKAE